MADGLKYVGAHTLCDIYNMNQPKPLLDLVVRIHGYQDPELDLRL